MDALTPLLMMWLSARSNRNAGPPRSAPNAPPWPTPTSPPPMPAFYAQTPAPPPAPSADPGGSSTPLADLAAKGPKPPPASAPPPKRKPAAKPRAPNIVPGILQSSLPVLKLQQALNRRGAKLKPDGLFGPKTAAAWSSMAKSKLLPSVISRVNPKLARVATTTYDTLSLPPIP